MASTYKVLGQSSPAANTLTTLYTVPGATSTVVSTISICNYGVSALVRVAVRIAGAAIASSQYIVYDTAVNANDTLLMTLGITLAATDIVSVYAGTATMTFGLFGVELT